MTNDEKWDLRFLSLAKSISEWSKDPSTKVGAVITRGRRVISHGYNGFPQNTDDSEERLNNREVKLALTIHAEMNAVIFADSPLDGCTVYIYPFMPCSHCAMVLIQKGIVRVVAPVNDNPRWRDSFAIAKSELLDAGVEVDLYDYILA